MRMLTCFLYLPEHDSQRKVIIGTVWTCLHTDAGTYHLLVKDSSEISRLNIPNN